MSNVSLKYPRCAGAHLAAPIAALAVLMCVPVAGWSAGPLTLEAAQRAALDRSRLLVAQDAGVAAAREMAVAASQLPDPVVKIGIDNFPIEGPDRFSIARDFMTMRRIGVMQEVTGADKRRLRGERFEREADKLGSERLAVVAQIERDTALAWLDRYFAEATARQIAGQIRVAAQEIELADGLYRGGRGSPAELIAARSTVAALEDRAREAAGRVRVATTVLARWVPDSIGQPLGAPPDIDALDVPLDALEKHLATHPELLTLMKQEEVAAADVRLALANKNADWTWEFAFQKRGSSYGNMISVGVSIPWQWDQKNRQDREVAAKLAVVDEARARREETTRTHLAELQSMVVEWETARERRRGYEADLVRLSRERSDALADAYRAGRSTLADVLAAGRNELELQLQKLQIEAQMARWWAQIGFLVPHLTTAGAGPQNGGKIGSAP